MHFLRTLFYFVATTTLLFSVLTLTACSISEKQNLMMADENNLQKSTPPSTNIVKNPKKEEYLFTQKALTKLGFNVGYVDGIWGKLSSQALDNFHLTKGLPLNGGLITAADIHYLKELTGLTPKSIRISKKRDKVNEKRVTQQGPELLILNAQTELLVRDNPFSEVIALLNSGTGVYILKRTEHWLEVESENQLRGFIKVIPSGQIK